MKTRKLALGLVGLAGMVAAVVGLGLALTAPASAQGVNPRCRDMSGMWENNQIEEQITFSQSGCRLSGTLYTQDFTHNFSGTVRGSSARVDIERIYTGPGAPSVGLTPGCRTVIRSTWNLSSDGGTIRRTLTGDSGTCDRIPRNTYSYNKVSSWSWQR